MSKQARVRSVEAIKDFRAAFCAFGDEARQALCAVDVEIQRAMEWLTHDQLKYWKSEVRRREERVNEAKMELSRARISKTFGDNPPVTDQLVALRKAKLRLEEAEEKVKTVLRWSQIAEEEVSEYRGPAQQLLSMLDVEHPRAVAVLDRTLDSLEAYLAAAPPPAPAPVSIEVDGVRVGSTPSVDPDTGAKPQDKTKKPGSAPQATEQDADLPQSTPPKAKEPAQ